MSGFLAEVERRAFKQAMFATRDEDAALDIVQDAMLKLAEKYADKPTTELPMLFQRILQNTIHDHFRRQKVRNTWTTLLSAFGKGEKKTMISTTGRFGKLIRTQWWTRRASSNKCKLWE
jgi:RNA polymerase sigma-70 factor (ECF subfamily)